MGDILKLLMIMIWLQVTNTGVSMVMIVIVKILRDAGLSMGCAANGPTLQNINSSKHAQEIHRNTLVRANIEKAICILSDSWRRMC